MKAIISDIHANFKALCSVFEDIEKQSVSEVICLGDIVGYGADPEACVDAIMEKTQTTLVGNHDYALIHGPIGFNPIAADVIRMTREIMMPHESVENETPDCFEPEYFPCVNHGGEPTCLILKHKDKSRWSFIEKLIAESSENSVLYVHASPLEPTHEYVYPDKFESMWNPSRINEMLNKVDWLAFCGHTHHPCAISSTMKCYYPEQCDYHLALDPEEKYIINVGSVGQPRDRDPRSCYLLYDEDAHTITWRRVAYNIDTTIKKIESMCGKDNWCGYRLRLGK